MTTRHPAPALALAALAGTLALSGCWSRESTNPYDPDAPATVPGELRVVFDLPPALPGDELSDPTLRAAALADLRVTAYPADGESPIAATAQADGTRTVRAPAGRYTVRIDHRRALFEPSDAAVEIELAERRDLRVVLRRTEIELGAEFGFGGAPVAPAGAFFDLRWLPDDVDDCVGGRTLRRFTLDGDITLTARIFRPLSERVCALAGAPGFETVAVDPQQLERDTLDFGRIELAPAPAAVELLGLPEARDLEAGRPARGTRRLGGRLVLLHVTLRAPLTFDPAAPADERVARVAVVDTPIGQDTALLERFVPLDQLPFEGSGAGAVEFVGALAPSRCAAFDAASADLNELLLQSEALGRALDERAHDGPRPTEWLVPYCLLGDDADTRQLSVALETAAGAVHRTATLFQVDRQAPSGVDIELSEVRPAVDGFGPLQRVVPSWRGRYQVHAASTLTLRVEETDPDPIEAQIPGLQWRVAYAVLSGQRYRGGWTFRACPDPLLVDFDSLDEEPGGPSDMGVIDDMDAMNAMPPMSDMGAMGDAGAIDAIDAMPGLPDGGVMKGGLPDGGGIVAPGDFGPPADAGPAPDAALGADLDADVRDAAPDYDLVQAPPADVQRVRSGGVGDPISLPLDLEPPLAPENGQPGAFHVHRNRVCLYIEDGAGNRRTDAIDVEVFAGRIEARLAAGADDRAGRDRWTGVECPVDFPPQDCPGFQNPFLVNGEIVFSTRVLDPTVDRTVHDVSIVDGESTYGLRAFVVEVDQRPEPPRPYRQGRRLVYGFGDDGTHRLRIYGRDLLDREIEFTIEGAGRIDFTRDTRPPTTVTRAFLTCPGCREQVEPCCDDPDDPACDPCLRCVPPNFVINDRLVAPADVPIPIRFLFDFIFPAPDERLCVGVRNVTGDTGERAFHALCTNATELDPPAADVLDPRGTYVEYGSDVFDPACNSDIDPGSLAVLYDGHPPQLLARADDPAIPAVDIVCRHLREVCPNAGRSCYRAISTSVEACGSGGETIVEQINLTLLDLVDSPLEGPFVRFRLVAVPDGDLDDIELESVCGEPDWGELIQPEGPDGPQIRRVATCADTPVCGCVSPGTRVSLRPPLEEPTIADVPVAVFHEGVLDHLTLATFDTANGVVADARLYLAVEDAVGNVAALPLRDQQCGGGGCETRRYQVPVAEFPDAHPALDIPSWWISHDCRSTDAGLQLTNNVADTSGPQLCGP